MITAHYSPYCLCRSCCDHAFWDSLTAMTDMQILQRVKGREMDEKQKKMIAVIELRVWNESMKGKAS